MYRTVFVALCVVLVAERVHFIATTMDVFKDIPLDADTHAPRRRFASAQPFPDSSFARSLRQRHSRPHDLDLSEATAPSGTCRHVDPIRTESGVTVDAAGFEDLIEVTPGTAIACAGDLETLWSHDGVARARQGECVLVSDVAGSIRFRYLSLDDFPAGVAFHPHGIDVWRGPNGRVEVFVVNHGYDRGGERIEIFELDIEGGALHYKQSISSPWLDATQNGILNDVAVTGENEVYVTSYLTFPDPPHGRPVLRKLQEMMAIFFGFANTKVFRCSFVRAPSGAVACDLVSSGHILINGITSFTRGSTVYVAAVDSLAKSLIVWQKCGDDLCQRVDFPLIHAVDNVQVALADKLKSEQEPVKLLVGTIIDTSRAPSGPEPAVSPGGLLEVTLEFDKTSLRPTRSEQRDLVTDPGEALPGIASGVVLGESIVLGSFRAPGLLTCRA